MRNLFYGLADGILKLITKLIPFLIVAGVIWILWIFVGYFQAADKNIKVSLIGVGSAIIAALVAQYYTKKREIASRHFIEKSQAYTPIFDLIFKLLENVKKDREMSEKDMLNQALIIKKQLMIWGSQDVLKAWLKFEADSGETVDANDIKPLINIDRVLRAIRKDLGHNDFNLDEGELLGLIIIAEDRDDFIKNIQEDSVISQEDK